MIVVIELKQYENGFHNTYTIPDTEPQIVPDGWAKIPDGMETPSFPCADIVCEEIDGVMTVTKWSPRELPPIPACVPGEDEITRERLDCIEEAMCNAEIDTDEWRAEIEEALCELEERINET